MATVQQEVAALYSAIFNRAPDQAGLNNWVNLIQGGASLTQTADGFVQHPVFTELYAGLTNIQFIQELYINVLGSEGDAKGIQNWANLLASGVSKAQVVADFVRGALDVDLEAMLDSGELTQAEYDAAVVRQDTLTNKANVGIYFADTFGAASNLNPATDTSTVAGLQADPAYLASQAAIANVTADAASVTAAKGRIDVAVTTDNPAANLIGANSVLTAALVDYQEKVAAQADALEAIALADNADETLGDAAIIEDEDDLADFVKVYTAADAQTFVTGAEDAVTAAQGDLADARNELTGARALETDLSLNNTLSAALAAVQADEEASELFDTLNDAQAALDSADADTSRVELLTDLRTAIANYVNAGGNIALEVHEAAGDEVTIADLLSELNDKLLAVEEAKTDAAVALAATGVNNLIAEIAGYDNLDTFDAPETATQTALEAALGDIADRQELIIGLSNAKNAFGAEDLGDDYNVALKAVNDRQDLIDAVTKAQADLADAVTALADANALYDAYVAATAEVTAAGQVIDDLDYSLVDSTAVANGDTIAATTDADLFVAGTDGTVDYTIGGLLASEKFSGDDLLFTGTNYAFGGTAASADFAALLSAGSTSALEVFFEQDGTDTIVHIETKAFANGAATPANDLVSITLTGVTAADLVFENGFVSFA